MARIYLDARNITDQPAGVARYAQALIAQLVRQAPQHEFVTLRHQSNQRPIVDDQPNLPELPVECPIDGVQNFVFGHRTLEAAIARGNKPDLYHCLFHLLPLKTRRVLGDIPVLTTLHDFVWIDHPDASQPTFVKARAIEAFARVALPHALRTSDKVIAISEPTRRRARSFIEDHKMVTISHGVDEAFFEPPRRPTGDFEELNDPERPCIVAIGNGKEYKNFPLLIDAFEELVAEGVSARLVLVGDCEDLALKIAHTQVSEWITVTETIDDQTLRRILGRARVFVFPSTVEGFGLPLLEAMAMGIPAVVANVEPMRSIADEAALFFSPDDRSGLAHLIRRIITDDELSKTLSRRGRLRAAQFRWDDTARRTLQLYDEMLRTSSTMRSVNSSIESEASSLKIG